MKTEMYTIAILKTQIKIAIFFEIIPVTKGLFLGSFDNLSTSISA